MIAGLMRSCLAVCSTGLLLAALGGCGGGPKPLVVQPGPDAAVARISQPVGSLVWVVHRGVHDRGAAGEPPSVDPRVLVAVLSPSNATWLVQGRMDTRSALQLAFAMQDDLNAAAPSKAHVMSVQFMRVPSGDPDSMEPIPGGQWVWLDSDNRASSSTDLVIALQDAHQQNVCLVHMDAATARTFQRQVLDAAAARPVRLTSTPHRGH